MVKVPTFWFVVGIGIVFLAACQPITEQSVILTHQDAQILEASKNALSATLPTQNPYPYPGNTLPTALAPYPSQFNIPSPSPISETPTPNCTIATKLPSPLVTEDISISLALQWVYGGSECINFEKQEVYVNNSGQGYSVVKPLLSGSFEENGLSKFILLTEMIFASDCHPCGAVIGGVIFVKSGDTWREEISNQHIIEVGSFGRAPRGDLMQIGHERYGAIFRSSYTSTGNSTEHTFVIAHVDGELKMLGFILTGEAEVVEGSWSYASIIEFVPGEHPVFHDLKITSMGTKYIGNSINPFEEVRLYTLTNGIYTLQQTLGD